MMEKLMIDAVVHHAREYKIDGFRFDLMSFHFVDNMLHIQEAVAGLTLEKDGVDGTKIYLYGEGWNFGETADNKLGPNASQANMYGTGIGTFNDRVRDGIRGGSPFSDPREQGFATGLFTDPSRFTSQQQTLQAQKAALLNQSDWIRAALAGNMRDFTFTDSSGQTVRASQLSYNGPAVGYTAAPIESVNFCSVHDNRTLFAAVQLKSAIPGATGDGGDDLTTRARRQVLAMSLIALGQGIPFFHAGDEILRTKGMDGNSFNSGDWFNRIDWTCQSSTWGIGLPVASENAEHWPLMRPLLGDPQFAPTHGAMIWTRDAFLDLLRIRASSTLFRMETLAEVQNKLHFLNTGPLQIPGLIVMRLDAGSGSAGEFGDIVVAFNATIGTVLFQNEQLKGNRFQLHPVQVQGEDEVAKQASLDNHTGTVKVPALTTAVFVAAR